MPCLNSIRPFFVPLFCSRTFDFEKCQGSKPDSSIDWPCGMACSDGSCCQQVFRSRLQLVWHQIKHPKHLAKHPVRTCIVTNECVLCKAVFSTKSIAQEHLQNSYHTGFCCQNLTKQAWSIVKVQKFECHLCAETFGSYGDFSEHLRGHLPVPIPATPFVDRDASDPGGGSLCRRPGCREGQAPRSSKRRRQVGYSQTHSGTWAQRENICSQDGTPGRGGSCQLRTQTGKGTGKLYGKRFAALARSPSLEGRPVEALNIATRRSPSLEGQPVEALSPVDACETSPAANSETFIGKARIESACLNRFATDCFENSACIDNATRAPPGLAPILDAATKVSVNEASLHEQQTHGSSSKNHEQGGSIGSSGSGSSRGNSAFIGTEMRDRASQIAQALTRFGQNAKHVLTSKYVKKHNISL